MNRFWQKTEGTLDKDAKVALAIVVQNSKGSPGTPAARMILSPKGQQQGTIGGGIMEKRLIEEMLLEFSSPKLPLPQLRNYVHQKGAQSEASGLICGGAQKVLILYLQREQDQPTIEALAEAERQEVLARAKIKPLVREISLQEEASAFSESPELMDGAEDWTVFLPLLNFRRVAIFGGGHCGTALAQTMHRLDYAVTLLETRNPFPRTDELSSEIQILQGPSSREVPKIRYPHLTTAVVMTHSLDSDVEALTAILPGQFPDIGLMGSRQKILQIQEQLQAKGFDPLQCQKIRAPFGIPFDSDTPEEIAISIAAQMLTERKQAQRG